MSAAKSLPERVAPRWAGYTAAAFAAEYAVGKLVMASRGELGLPGHAAPPEVTERFDGDVVVAQLGNAGLGVASLALALALVQTWGRRIPPLLLAVATVAVVVSSAAGAVVVGASLAGIREDHGQWGVDSLVLGAVPLVAWCVLAVAAIRAARAAGMPRLRVRVPSAALVAASVALAYGALKLHWALGGDTLIWQAPLPEGAREDMLARSGGVVAGHWASVGLAVLGVSLALALDRRVALPKAVAYWLPGLIGTLMLLRAGWGAVSDVASLSGLAGAGHPVGWDAGLWSPMFAIWGAAWLKASRDRRGSRDRTAAAWFGAQQRRRAPRGAPSA